MRRWRLEPDRIEVVAGQRSPGRLPIAWVNGRERPDEVEQTSLHGRGEDLVVLWRAGRVKVVVDVGQHAQARAGDAAPGQHGDLRACHGAGHLDIGEAADEQQAGCTVPEPSDVL